MPSWQALLADLDMWLDGSRELLATLLGGMKKQRPNKRLARIVEKRTYRALASKRVAHKARFARSSVPGQLRSHRKAWQRGHEKKRYSWEPRRAEVLPLRLEAPQEFSLTKAAHRDALLQFLRKLNHLTLVAGKTVKISFRNTRKMFPEGTLLFAAELDVILKKSYPRAPVRCSRPSDPIVNQLFKHLGLAAKMRLKEATAVTAENVKYWRVKTDTLVDGRHTESLINDYKEHFSAKESAKLYEGLTEAMTNAKQHAYAQDSGATTEPRWWMFSQMRNEKLTVCFCDLGMGFRNSLVSGQRWAKQVVDDIISRIGFGRSDAQYIKAAFELGKTRTGETHRGKGLDELKKVIESVGGHLRILSHKGYYLYVASDETEQCFDFEEPVPGTVISWQVDLNKKETRS